MAEHSSTVRNGDTGLTELDQEDDREIINTMECLLLGSVDQHSTRLGVLSFHSRSRAEPPLLNANLRNTD